MSENPYSSPNFNSDSFHPAPAYYDTSIVTQIRMVAIFMIVNGACLLLYGLFLIGTIFFVFYFMMQEQNQPERLNSDGEFMAFSFVIALYGGLALLAITPGIIQIIAGYKNLYYRSYILGIVGLITGGLGLLTCYCAPTSLGVLIFGLIVYMSPTAKFVFSLGKNGLNQREIEETLRKGPPSNQNSYPPPV